MNVLDKIEYSFKITFITIWKIICSIAKVIYEPLAKICISIGNFFVYIGTGTSNAFKRYPILCWGTITTTLITLILLYPVLMLTILISLVLLYLFFCLDEI